MKRSTVPASKSPALSFRDNPAPSDNTVVPCDVPGVNEPLASPDADADRAFFTTSLLRWYEANKRPLPWRATHDPYAIWISEMMLQQTQVATVIPYWTRWMERFPTIAALADAPLEDVLKAWQGLGYYARARNLHRAAQVIIEKHCGVFPTEFEDVLALPGIGPYTAGAICSIALGRDTPIVDANVIRVLCRYFGIGGDPKSPAVQAQLWEMAERLIPTGRASEFNQGMMELGALICQSKPDCARCPVQKRCIAFTTGRADSLPEFAARAAFTEQVDVSAIVRHAEDTEKVLLVRRPAGGLWGGLWEFPRATRSQIEETSETAQRAVAETAGLTVQATDNVVGSVRHGVTTRKILLLGVECHLEQSNCPDPAEGFTVEWVRLPDVERLALSSPQARLYQQIVAAGKQLSLFGE